MPFEATITSIHQMTPRLKQFVVEADRQFEFDPGQHTTARFERDDPDDEKALVGEQGGVLGGDAGFAEQVLVHTHRSERPH